LTTAPGVGASNWLHRIGAVYVMVAFAESNDWSAPGNGLDGLRGDMVRSFSAVPRSMTAARARFEKHSSQRKWKEGHIASS
jgi:hypothetical protein